MRKQTLIELTATQTGYGIEEVATIVNKFMGVLVGYGKEGHRIELRGFGVFRTVTHKAKVSNLATTRHMTIPERRVIKFKPSKFFKPNSVLNRLIE